MGKGPIRKLPTRFTQHPACGLAPLPEAYETIAFATKCYQKEILLIS